MGGYNPFNERRAGKVPSDIASRHDVSDRAVRVYSVLTRFAGRDGECYPGLNKIASFSGKSIRRIQDALAELVEKNLIQYERVPGKKMRRIRFITPDSSVLHTSDDISQSEPDSTVHHTPDSSVHDTHITPDTFDNLTGHFRSVSPDTFGKPHIKELKHILKHTLKQSPHAEMIPTEIDPPLFDGGPKPPMPDAKPHLRLSWGFHVARFKAGDLFFDPYDGKHLKNCKLIVEKKARGDYEEAQRRARNLFVKSQTEDWWECTPGMLLSQWEKLADLPKTYQPSANTIEEQNRGLREHLSGLKSQGSG